MKTNIFITKCLLLTILLIFCIVNISAADTEYPQFSNYWDNNGTQVGGGTAYLNVTVTSTNGIVVLQTMEVGFIASNSSGDPTRFNVTIEFMPAGTYLYNWVAYGNGTDALLNFSNNQSYTVNETPPDTNPPYFTNFANQNLLQGQSLNYDINAADDEDGLGSFEINWTNTFSIVSSTGVLTNTSALPIGDYYINVSINDTLGNLNSSILLINVSVIPDTTAPSVNLVSPSDSSTRTSSSTVTFTYSVTDSNNIANCSLIIDGEIDQTETTITKDISQSFAKSMSNANYMWSVNCTDVANNRGNSSTYSLTVNYTIPSSTPPEDTEENITIITNDTTPIIPTDDTNYSAPDDSGSQNTFIRAISSFVNKLGGVITNLIDMTKPYLKFYFEKSKPYRLWIFTSIGVGILLIIVSWRLRVALKKIKFKRIQKKLKDKYVKENLEAKKPEVNTIEEHLISPNKVVESKYIEDTAIKKPIAKSEISIKENPEIKKQAFKPLVEGNQKFKPLIEKQSIEKNIIQNKAIESQYGEDDRKEYLKRMTDIEEKQKIIRNEKRV